MTDFGYGAIAGGLASLGINNVARGDVIPGLILLFLSFVTTIIAARKERS